MTRLDWICRIFIIVPGVVGAVVLNASLPQYWAMPSAQAGQATPRAEFHRLGHSVTILIAEPSR